MQEAMREVGRIASRFACQDFDGVSAGLLPVSLARTSMVSVEPEMNSVVDKANFRYCCPSTENAGEMSQESEYLRNP